MNLTVAKGLETDLQLLNVEKKLAAMRSRRVGKAQEGDKKTIFGRPATFRSGKFVVDEPGAGGGEAEEKLKKPERPNLDDPNLSNQERSDLLFEFTQQSREFNEQEGIPDEQTGQSQEEQERIAGEIARLSPEDQEFADQNFDSEDLDGLDVDGIENAIDELRGGEGTQRGQSQEAIDAVVGELGKLSPEDLEFADQNFDTEDLDGLSVEEIQDAIEELKAEDAGGEESVAATPEEAVASLTPEQKQAVLDDQFTDEMGESELEPGETLESVLDELIENIGEEGVTEAILNAKQG